MQGNPAHGISFSVLLVVVGGIKPHEYLACRLPADDRATPGSAASMQTETAPSLSFAAGAALSPARSWL